MKNDRDENVSPGFQLPTQDQMDQILTFQSKNWPIFWRTLYNNMITEGFLEHQAFELLKVYILSQSPGGARP